MGQNLDAAEKSSPLLLVDLPMVPHADGYAVVFAYKSGKQRGKHGSEDEQPLRHDLEMLLDLENGLPFCWQPATSQHTEDISPEIIQLE